MRQLADLADWAADRLGFTYSGKEPNRRVAVLPRNIWGPSHVKVPPAEPTVAWQIRVHARR